MMNVVILCRSVSRWLGEVTEGTYINPPTNTDPTNEVGEDDSDQAVLLPIMGEPDVAEVMTKEDELMPEGSQRDGAEEKPLIPIEDERR